VLGLVKVMSYSRTHETIVSKSYITVFYVYFICRDRAHVPSYVRQTLALGRHAWQVDILGLVDNTEMNIV